jgi:hypothetical protein
LYEGQWLGARHKWPSDCGLALWPLDTDRQHYYDSANQAEFAAEVTGK